MYAIYLSHLFILIWLIQSQTQFGSPSTYTRDKNAWMFAEIIIEYFL